MTETAIKERPILFSGAMVRALLAGTKLQTRRAIKPQPANGISNINGNFVLHSRTVAIEGGSMVLADPNAKNIYSHVRCPYGQPGERLWVRETFGYNHAAAEAKDVLVYRADHSGDQLVTWPRREQKRSYQQSGHKIEYTEDANHWHPSIFMPRTRSRILLEITDVRVERLNDISEEDAKAEGINLTHTNMLGGEEWEDYLDDNRFHFFAVDSYKSLWRSINGLDSWDKNPWCWVVSFRRIEPVGA